MEDNLKGLSGYAAFFTSGTTAVASWYDLNDRGCLFLCNASSFLSGIWEKKYSNSHFGINPILGLGLVASGNLILPGSASYGECQTDPLFHAYLVPNALAPLLELYSTPYFNINVVDLSLYCSWKAFLRIEIGIEQVYFTTFFDFDSDIFFQQKFG